MTVGTVTDDCGYRRTLAASRTEATGSLAGATVPGESAATGPAWTVAVDLAGDDVRAGG